MYITLFSNSSACSHESTQGNFTTYLPEPINLESLGKGFLEAALVSAQIPSSYNSFNRVQSFVDIFVGAHRSSASKSFDGILKYFENVQQQYLTEIKAPSPYWIANITKARIVHELRNWDLPLPGTESTSSDEKRTELQIVKAEHSFESFKNNLSRFKHYAPSLIKTHIYLTIKYSFAISDELFFDTSISKTNDKTDETQTKIKAAGDAISLGQVVSFEVKLQRLLALLNKAFTAVAFLLRGSEEQSILEVFSINPSSKLVQFECDWNTNFKFSKIACALSEQLNAMLGFKLKTVFVAGPNKLVSAERRVDLSAGKKLVLISSSILQHENVSEKQLPLLYLTHLSHFIDKDNNNSGSDQASLIEIRPNNLTYKTLLPAREITQVTITLTTEDGNLLEFSTDKISPTVVTLHIRPKV